MVDDKDVCSKHGTVLKWRKDKNGKFCPTCMCKHIGWRPTKRHDKM